jgi:hypothetical protein
MHNRRWKRYLETGYRDPNASDWAVRKSRRGWRWEAEEVRISADSVAVRRPQAQDM